MDKKLFSIPMFMGDSMCEESVPISISNSKYCVLLQLVIEGTDKASVPLLDPNDLNLVAEVSLKVILIVQ